MITIKLEAGGHKYEGEFLLVRTNAPVEYDGFGTIRLYGDGEGARYALIRTEHADWHKGRYGSGLYTFEEEEVDQSIGSWVIEKLFERIKTDDKGAA